MVIRLEINTPTSTAVIRSTNTVITKTMIINTTGRKGDGIFFDKWCEHSVRSIKSYLRGCYGKVDDLLEKILNGMSLVNTICEHDKTSILRGKEANEKSHNIVTETVRHILEEEVASSDPFDREREQQHEYSEKARGSPYTGLLQSKLNRFILRMRDTYRQKY